MEDKIFIHNSAIVDTKHIGKGSRIWAFVHILDGVKIGKNANICDHCFIENGVVIGDNVTIKCGVWIWDGVLIEDDVFIGPNVTFCNDKYPKSKNKNWKKEGILIKKGASLGANCTILPGIVIGEGAMVGAGSVVVGDVKPGSTVVGNPAKER